MPYTPEQVKEAIFLAATLRILDAKEEGNGEVDEATQHEAEQLADLAEDDNLARLLDDLNRPERPAVTLSALDEEWVPPDPSYDGEVVLEEILSSLRAMIRRSREDLLATLHRAGPQQAISAARAWVERWQPELELHLSDAQLAGVLKGMQGVASGVEKPAAAQLPEFLRSILAPSPVDPGETRLETITRAVEDLGSRKLLTQIEYDALQGQAKQTAFTVAGAQTEEVVTAVRDAVMDAVREGKTLREFREQVRESVGEKAFLSPAQAETTFRTEVMKSYSNGQERLLADADVGDLFPYREYLAIHDDRVRPDHLAMMTAGIQGTNIFRHDDPVFQLFRPPWAWNCRCAYRPLTVRTAAARGIEEAIAWQESGRPPSHPAWVPMPEFRPAPEFQRVELSTEWDESKHPRDRGKFSKKEGGKVNSASSQYEVKTIGEIINGGGGEAMAWKDRVGKYPEEYPLDTPADLAKLPSDLRNYGVQVLYAVADSSGEMEGTDLVDSLVKSLGKRNKDHHLVLTDLVDYGMLTHEDRDGFDYYTVTPTGQAIVDWVTKKAENKAQEGTDWRPEESIPEDYYLSTEGGESRGGVDPADARALAEFYASIFTALEQAGSPPDDDLVEDAIDILEEAGLTLTFDEEEGRWEVESEEAELGFTLSGEGGGPWVHDPGPRSKNRWRNRLTGRVRYQQHMPGSAEHREHLAQRRKQVVEARRGRTVDVGRIKERLARHASGPVETLPDDAPRAFDAEAGKALWDQASYPGSGVDPVHGYNGYLAKWSETSRNGDKEARAKLDALRAWKSQTNFAEIQRASIGKSEDETAIEEAKNLDAALDQAPDLARNVTVWRGVKNGDPEQMWEEADSMAKSGQAMSWQSFTSSSLDPKTALLFSGQGGQESPVLLEITTGKGIYLGGPKGEGEGELILPRKQEWRVVGKKVVDMPGVPGGKARVIQVVPADAAGKAEPLAAHQQARAAGAWRMLERHHGELALHRVEELTDAAEKALAKLPAGDTRALALKGELARLHHVSRMATGEVVKEEKPAREKRKPHAPPESPQQGTVYRVATEDLHVDPSRFQFKLNTNKAGVTKEFKNVTAWDDDLSGVIAVWKDPSDGRTYVVNGHHRKEMADRFGAGSLNVKYMMKARDAKEARAEGALINIAEGRGSAIDAAKFMRDTGTTVGDFQKRGISLDGKVAVDAIPLTKLSDRIFAKVASGEINEQKALAVAKHLDNHDLQGQLFSLLEKREDEGKDMPPKVIEEMAKKMAETPKTEKTEKTLFGDITSTESLFVPACELQSFVRGDLSRDVSDFKAVAGKRRAGRLAESGVGEVDTEAAKGIAQEAGEARAVYDTLVNRKGPIADAINNNAEEYSKAKTKEQRDAIKQRVAEQVRAAIIRELSGPLDRGAEGPAVQGSAGTRGPDPQAAGDGGRGDPAGAGLTAIKEGDSGFHEGYAVRRTGKDTWRTETATGFVEGGQEKIRAHVEGEKKKQNIDRRRIDEAISRHASAPKAEGLDIVGGAGAQALAKLKPGTELVVTEGGYKGRTGKLVHDDNRLLLKLEGSGEEIPVGHAGVEPLDPAHSWRVEKAKQEGPEQGEMFQGEKRDPTPAPEPANGKEKLEFKSIKGIDGEPVKQGGLFGEQQHSLFGSRNPANSAQSTDSAVDENKGVGYADSGGGKSTPKEGAKMAEKAVIIYDKTGTPVHVFHGEKAKEEAENQLAYERRYDRMEEQDRGLTLHEEEIEVLPQVKGPDGVLHTPGGFATGPRKGGSYHSFRILGPRGDAFHARTGTGGPPPATPPAPAQPAAEGKGEPWQVSAKEFHGHDLDNERKTTTTVRERPGNDVRNYSATKSQSAPKYVSADLGTVKKAIGATNRATPAELADLVTPQNTAHAMLARLGSDARVISRGGAEGFEMFWVMASGKIYSLGNQNPYANPGGKGSYAYSVPADEDSTQAFNRLYHRQEVLAAVKAGRPVPPEVLADYPEASET